MSTPNDQPPVEFEVVYFQAGRISHSYREAWALTDLFCPRCGAKEVFEEQGGGDYYAGSAYLCRKCGAVFHGGVSKPCESVTPDPRGETEQRLAALRKLAP